MNNENSSYKQIVKSTGIFGGVQIFNIILGVIRQKAIAVLLGPAGLGLISAFQSVFDLIKSTSSMGIDTAGIKDIASSADNKEQQAYKISVFKWWIMLTAGFGSLLCLIFCYPISVFAFNDGGYALHIAILSLSIFLSSLSTGQLVILQGTRNIAFMAKANLWGNAVGLPVSLLLYWFLGVKGIIPAFITGSLIFLIFSSHYAGKIKLQKTPPLKLKEAFRQGLAPLRLGAFIVIVSIMETASMFLIKAFLIRVLGEDGGLIAIGTLQPAWTITLIYLSLVLKSMGTDFFPRLCSISNNAGNMRKLVNEQTYIALLVTIPIVVVTMMFSQQILSLLYTSEFVSGTPLLQWHVAGSFFKVLSWPMAFILLARNKGPYYLFTEIIYFAFYLGGSYLLFPYLGTRAVGIAYLLAYLSYNLTLFLYVYKVYQFSWNKDNIRVLLVGIFFILLSSACVLYLGVYQVFLSIILSFAAFSYSVYMFNRVINVSDFVHEIKGRIFRKK